MADHPYIPVPDTAALIMGYETDTGYGFSNAFNFRNEGGWPVEELENLTATAIDAWAETMASAFSNVIGLRQVTARDLSSEDGASIITADTAFTHGTRNGVPAALNMATTITFRTLKRGRSFRGRIFHAGLNVPDMATAKLWSPTPVAVAQSAVEQFVAAIKLGTGADLVVVSRKQGNVWLAEAETTEVSQIVGRRPIATQRLRVKV